MTCAVGYQITEELDALGHSAINGTFAEKKVPWPFISTLTYVTLIGQQFGFHREP